MKRYLIVFVYLALLVLLSYFPVFRLDLSSEKRYSLAPITEKLMQYLDAPLEVTLYLDGDLNPGFFRLRQATIDLFEELAARSSSSLRLRSVNPSQAEDSEQRSARHLELSERGLTPTAVYERDKEGKAIRNLVFPWVEIAYKDKKIPVSLLKNIRTYSGEENLNASIESLEFEITDALRRLSQKGVPKIAFLEGHGEYSEAETYDISKTLSRYFQIDRGRLGSDAAILDAYQVVIVAAPRQAFTESEKYIIDQYIMRGGRVLWLIDGVRLAREELSKSGISPLMDLDLNLSDMLFRYGVRINPVVLQDVQCVNLPINIAPSGEKPHFEPAPWFYAPLLLTSPQHPITRNLTEVRADFPSSLSLVGDGKGLTAHLLLATSDNTHIVATPAKVDLGLQPQPDDKGYFNASYQAVAFLLEGVFDSNFAHRMPPPDLQHTQPLLRSSKATRQIVVANAEIIRNETTGLASDSTTLPLGFDRYSQELFGNKDFIRNAVLYLSDHDGWMELRSRSLKLRLLNKKLILSEALFWKLLNVLLPLAVLLFSGLVFFVLRRKRFAS